MIPLVRPVFGKQEKQVLNKIIDSRILASGRYVADLEKECARAWHSKHAIATSSGTTALHAALLACGIKPGDKVLTTPLTFIATANSILFCGAKPVFCDIDPETFNICPEEAEDILKKQKGIKAIIVVHLYGTPAKINSFVRLAKKYKVKLIEDCAQSQSARYNGKYVGTFGDASAFSFYATKNMSTGEGGLIMTNNSKINQSCRQIINHGRATHSMHTVLGFNFRLTNLAAGIGLIQLKRLALWNFKRRKNAAFLTKHLKNLRYITTPAIPKSAEPVFHQYTIRVKASLRDKFTAFLTKNGIGWGIYYPEVIYRQPLYKKLGYKQNLCSNAERAVTEIVSLPVHPSLSSKDLNKIVKVIQSFKP